MLVANQGPSTWGVEGNMQSAGSRNPQAVYDGGLKQLSELERAGAAALDGMGNCYGDVTEKLETEIKERMQKRVGEQEELVHSLVEQCLVRIRASLQLECDRSEVQLKEIVNKLMWAGRKYQLQVQMLTNRGSDRVKEFDENNNLRYKTAAAAAIAELDSQNLAACKQFQDNVDGYRAAFHAESEAGLTALAGSAEDANASLSQLFASESEAMQAHQRNSDNSLTGTANRANEAIKTEVKKQGDGLQKFANQIMEGAQARFIESGDSLQAVLQTTLSESSASFERSVEDALVELGKHQEKNLGELNNFARQRGEALATFSDKQFKQLDGELHRVMTQVDKKTLAVVSTLQQRLDRQTDTHAQMQVEKQKSVEQLMRALEDLWHSFEQEMRDLSLATARELSDACSLVQAGIAQTQTNCLNEIEAQADKQVHEVRTAQDEMLRQIANLRQQAIANVRRACGGMVDLGGVAADRPAADQSDGQPADDGTSSEVTE